MARAWSGKPRGILRHEWEERDVVLERFAASAALGAFVDYYWSARWDLRGREPRLEESLPHPCIHVVFEYGRGRVYGVLRGRFARYLEGRDEVFAIKFHPGGFHPFIERSLSELTDRVLPIAEVLGAEGARLESEVLAAASVEKRVAVVESLLGARAETLSPEVTLGGTPLEVRVITEHIRGHPGVTRVDDLIPRFAPNVRALQRLFQRTVGVGPKWVIQRYRLHEAVARIVDGHASEWAQLAAELGYTDQAHFIRDFRAVVGAPPGAYADELRAERES